MVTPAVERNAVAHLQTAFGQAAGGRAKFWGAVE